METEIMKIFLISLLILIGFTACCPEIQTKKTVKLDSIIVEKIIKDTLYLKTKPIIRYISDDTIEIKPFEAVKDTVLTNRHKKTRINAKFTLRKPDSANFDIKISDVTGNSSRTVTKIKTITLNHTIKEKLKWYEYLIWISVGFFLGVMSLTIAMVIK